MKAEVQGRALVRLFVVMGIVLVGGVVQAARVTIFDVRKSLPLTSKDPIYHDYFINAGAEAGLKVGAVVTVSRQIPMHDPMQNRSQGDLDIPVAKLYIIHVQNNLSVARFYAAIDRSDLPTLEYESVMTGDRIDLSKVEYPSGKRKPNAASVSRVTKVPKPRPETEKLEEANSASSGAVDAAATPALTASPKELPVNQVAPVTSEIH